jgi:hypothetical protein
MPDVVYWLQSLLPRSWLLGLGMRVTDMRNYARESRMSFHHFGMKRKSHMGNSPPIRFAMTFGLTLGLVVTGGVFQNGFGSRQKNDMVRENERATETVAELREFVEHGP